MAPSRISRVMSWMKTSRYRWRRPRCTRPKGGMFPKIMPPSSHHGWKAAAHRSKASIKSCNTLAWSLMRRYPATLKPSQLCQHFIQPVCREPRAVPSRKRSLSRMRRLLENRKSCSSVPTAAEEHHGTQSTEKSGGGLGDDAHIVDESISTRPSVSRPEKGNATYVGKGGSTT